MKNVQNAVNEICGENVREKIVQYTEHLRLLNKEGLKATYLLGKAFYTLKKLHNNRRKWIEEGCELSGYSERSLKRFVKFYDFINMYPRFLRVGGVPYTVLFSKITQLQKTFEDNPSIGQRWSNYFSEKVLKKEDIEPAWKKQLRLLEGNIDDELNDTENLSESDSACNTVVNEGEGSVI